MLKIIPFHYVEGRSPHIIRPKVGVTIHPVPPARYAHAESQHKVKTELYKSSEIYNFHA